MSTIEGPQTISSGALKILGGKLSITSFPNTYSLEFDGVNDYIEGGGNSPAGAFTISFWIKIETPPLNNDTDYWFGGASSGILLSIHRSIYGQNTVRAGVHTSFVNAFGNQLATSYGSITPDAWHQVTVTWDSTTLTIYIDGSSSATTTSGVEDPPAAAWDFGQAASQYSLGIVDEFAMWDTGLSADAVTAIYNSGMPLNLLKNSGNYTNSGDLVRYYRFEEGSGEAIDSTGTANGDITGASFSSDVPYN